MSAESALDPWIIARTREWYSPDLVESARLKEAIFATENAISALDYHTSTDERQLDDSKGLRDKLRHQLLCCRSLFAPIRLLPPDILLHILILCGFDTVVDVYESRIYSSDRSCIDIKTAIGLEIPQQICFMWSTFVATKPTLWSRLEFRINCNSQNPLEAETVEIVHGILCSILARTQQAALDICITIYHYWQHAALILLPILKESHRWRDFCILLYRKQFDDNSFACLEHALQSLETLKIIEYPTAGGTKSQPCRLFFDTPSLRKVEQNYSPLGSYRLPWNQLQSIVAHGGQGQVTDRYADIFASATSLQSLEVGFSDYTCQIERDPPLPSLPIVSLKIFKASDSVLFTQFSLPYLRSLSMKGSKFDVALLLQVAPKLQHLCFSLATSSFPIDLFCNNIAFPELNELIIVRGRSRGREREESGLQAPHDFAIKFPKLSRLTCKFQNAELLEECIPVMHAALSSTINDKLRMSLLVDFLSDINSLSSSIPVLQDLAARGTEIGILSHGRPNRTLEEIADELRQSKEGSVP